MARIAGVDLPRDKRVEIGLTYIYGIGRASSNRILSEAGVKLFLFEPSFNENKFFTAEVIRDINEFKSVSDVIVTNRWNDDLLDVKDKVFTRDLFFNN